jgi:hypothetical protein
MNRSRRNASRSAPQVVFPVFIPRRINWSNPDWDDLKAVAVGVPCVNDNIKWMASLVSRFCQSQPGSPGFVHVRLLEVPEIPSGTLFLCQASVESSYTLKAGHRPLNQREKQLIEMPPGRNCFSSVVTNSSYQLMSVSRLELGVDLQILEGLAAPVWKPGKSLFLTSGWGLPPSLVGPMSRESIKGHKKDWVVWSEGFPAPNPPAP